ncbi:MAG: ABC transporter permease [Candidatus Tectomicrobia bacterium]|nr:ABC transporter permease [Candidatus Tectomicrobia bacterium]
MSRFILSRLWQAFLVLVIVSIIVFSMMRLIPGDPIFIMLGDEYSPQAYERLKAQFGLDQPVFVQYFLWIKDILRGEFGYSYISHKDVSTLLLDAFYPTFVLVIGTVIVGLIIAFPSGIIAAIKRDTHIDYLSMSFAITGYSMPSFWKGIILIWVFAVILRWFPTMGYVSPLENFSKALWHMILPSITLGTFFAGLVARIIRSSLLEVLDQDYIKMARAKGVKQAALVYKHALQNSLIPVVTVIGLQFGALLGGAVLTEVVFSLPGLGRLTVTAIFNREYHVVQASVLIQVVFVVLTNFAVDVTYAFLNPKIRY